MSDTLALAQFLEHLRQRGFEVSADPDGNGYQVREQESEDSRPASRLTVESALFDEYFHAAAAHWELPPGSAERGDEVLSLMVTQVEAALASVDADGRNYVVELGLRRDSAGRVEWYQIEDPDRTEQPVRTAQPDPELRWVARPTGSTDIPR
jgi:hypothetical protein